MRLPIDAGELAGNTECAQVIGYARADADLEALFDQMLPPEEAAKLLWPREAAGEWIEGPVYRSYIETGDSPLVPEVFDKPAAHAPCHMVLGLYGVAKGTPTRDAMRYTPEF